MLFTQSHRKFLLKPVVVYCLFHEKNKTIDEVTLNYIVASSPASAKTECAMPGM